MQIFIQPPGRRGLNREPPSERKMQLPIRGDPVRTYRSKTSISARQLIWKKQVDLCVGKRREYTNRRHCRMWMLVKTVCTDVSEVRNE